MMPCSPPSRGVLPQRPKGCQPIAVGCGGVGAWCGSGGRVLSVQHGRGQSDDSLAADGRPVFLYFFAVWCGVCRAELGRLKEIYPDYSEAVAFYVVGTDPTESLGRLEKYRKEEGYPWPVAEPVGRMLADFRILRQSTKIAFDSRGHHLSRRLRRRRRGDVAARLRGPGGRILGVRARRPRFAGVPACLALLRPMRRTRACREPITCIRRAPNGWMTLRKPVHARPRSGQNFRVHSIVRPSPVSPSSGTYQRARFGKSSSRPGQAWPCSVSLPDTRELLAPDEPFRGQSKCRNRRKPRPWRSPLYALSWSVSCSVMDIPDATHG